MSERMAPFRKGEGPWPPHGDVGYIIVDNKPRQKVSGYIHPRGKMNRAARRSMWREQANRNSRMAMRRWRNPILTIVPKETT